MNDIKTFLNNFLTAIDYPDDKEEFINNLTSAIYLETINVLLDLQSQEKKEQIKQQLSLATTPENLQEVVNNNFDKVVFENTIKDCSQKVFLDYLDTIDSSLTEEQKIKIQQYFASVTPQTTAK